MAKSGNIWKRIAKITVILYFALITLPASLFILVRTPFIQNYIVKQTTSYLSRQLNTEISIGSIYISFFLDLEINDLKVNDQRNNLLASIDQLEIGFNSFIIGNNNLLFRKAELTNPSFFLRKYKGEAHTNLQFIIDYFATDKVSDKESTPIHLRIKKVILNNAEFAFIDENAEEFYEKQINFEDIHLTRINLHANNVHITDSISADILNLTFHEKSGFSVQEMKTKFSFSDKFLKADELILHTQHSRINGNIHMLYESTAGFSDFVHAVSFQSEFRKTLIDFSDIAAFAPALNNVVTRLYVSGHVNGSISNLNTKDLIVETGRNTRLQMNCMIMGLPDISETFFDLNISKLSTSSSDLISLLRDLNIEPSEIQEINKFAQFDIRGSFIGFINSFYSDFALQSNIGDVSGKMSFKTPADAQPYYIGSLETNEFNIGHLLQNDMLGIVTANLELAGEGIQMNSMNISAEGNISEITINNYNYTNIDLAATFDQGVFDGDVSANDPNIRFDFSGKISFNEDIPVYAFQANIHESHLNKLNLNRNDSLAFLSGQFNINFSGTSTDNYIGTANLKNVNYREGKSTYFIDSLFLSQDSIGHSEKRLVIRSNIVDGFIEGQYNFSESETVVSRFLADYITHLDKDQLQDGEEYIPDFNIRFGFEIKDFDIISGLFIPALSVEKHTIAKGSFNSLQNTLFIDLTSGLIEYNDIKLQKSVTTVETFSKNIYVTVNALKVSYIDSIFIENFIGSSVIYKDNINFSLFWDNYDALALYTGDIQGTISFPDSAMTRITFLPSSFTVQNLFWEIQDKNSIHFVKDMILVNGLKITSLDQEVFIHGIASGFMHDYMNIRLKNFKLDNLRGITSQYGLDINGVATGNVELKSALLNPYLTGNLQITGFSFNEQEWGDFYIYSEYNNLNKSLFADVKIQNVFNTRISEPLSFSGNYFFDRVGDELDFVCRLSAFDLKLIEPFLDGQIRVNEGRTSGEIFIKGNAVKPDITGKLWFMRSYIHVNYLNTFFALKDTIRLESNKIFANNFLLSDARGKDAYADILILHDFFTDFRLDMKLRTVDDFVFMNTGPVHNEDFYGTIVANGQVSVTGKPDDITMTVFARTGRGTQFYLPMDAAGSVYEQNFINFISTSESDIEVPLEIKQKEQLGFKMNLDLEVTPDAEMLIIFDPTIGDIMRGKAKGNLRIEFDINDEFIMYGDLELVDGDYLFTLGNVISKKFFISPGGKLSWTGSPYNATIDINTYYPLRTRLLELVSHIDSSEIYRRKIPVNLELLLKNDLLTPDITFNISLPQSDENTKNIMNSAITSDQELNRQVFSLLIFNSFVQPEASFSTPNYLGGMGTTTLEFVSNQFNNWVSQISRDFDIGINYRPGTELTTDEIEVLFSTQMISDRVRIEGNFGVGGNQIGEENTSGQNFLGDVSIEYRISGDDRLFLRAFNRSNPIDAITQNSPYTQGVGIFYKRDFDRIKDLLKRKQKKKSSDEKE
jgi:hypothetical protein